VDWELAGRPVGITEKSSPACAPCSQGSFHAVVNPIAHIHIETPWLTKQRFVAGAAAAMPVAGGLALAIRLRFHNHAPEEVPIGLTLDQQAADELGGDLLGGAGEEALREGWEVLEGRGGYGIGFVAM